MGSSGPNREYGALLKRILVPFYVVRIAVYIFYFAALCSGMTWVLANDRKYLRLLDRFNSTSAFRIIMTMVAIMTVIVLCFVMDVVCIVKHARKTLSQRFFLIVNVALTAVWTVVFVLSLIGLKTTLTIIISSVIYAFFVGLLVYASVAFHQRHTVSRYSTIVYEAPVVGNYEPYSQQMSDVPVAKPQASASAHLLEHTRYG